VLGLENAARSFAPSQSVPSLVALMHGSTLTLKFQFDLIYSFGYIESFIFLRCCLKLPEEVLGDISP